MLRIVVTGDRHWTDSNRVQALLDRFSGPIELIHGDCMGADRIAAQIGKEKGWNVRAFPAEWSKYGKSAGPIRNRQMLDTQPNCVIWFHDNLERSKGTLDMIRAAEERKIILIQG